MIDVEQKLRRQVRRVGTTRRKFAFGNHSACAGIDRSLDLRPDRVRRLRANDRSQRRGLMQWATENVFARELDEAADEAIVDPAIDVDALRAAARLTAVEVS